MINRDSKLAMQFWETGKLSCPVLDFHGHMDEHPAIYFPAPHVDDMIKSMDNVGIRWLFFCNHIALDDPLDGEQYNVRAVKKYPDRLRAYHCFHSRHLNPEKEIREVEDNPDIYIGFKILGDYNAYPISDYCHDPYYQYLSDTGKLLLLHTWGNSPNDGYDQVAEIAERFPKMTIICGHSFFGSQIDGIECTKKYPNIYYELTAIPIVRGYFEDIVQHAGSERVLFGTDLPWFSSFHGIGMILSADITDEDRLNILYRNGDRLLSRFPWYSLK